MERLRVLVVGGYGVFGGRIVSLLEMDARLTLVVAGRSAQKAGAFVASRGPVAAVLETLLFDRDGDVAGQLAGQRLDVVVDASGPFQAYGYGRYRLIEACIELGLHYLDLADGSEFVAGVAAFAERAREGGVYVLSGVSSFPVLTAAVVRELAGDMARVDRISGGIAPSPFAGVGENVIRAIASYAGQPTPVRRGGVMGQGHPFTESRRFTVAPPGRLPLKSTLFSLVDVPDLRALCAVRPEASDIWMGAGPVPEFLHRALIGFAWLVRVRLVASLSPLAALMHFVMNQVGWGEHRGGMFVVVDGADEAGDAVSRSWHLLAEGDDGPLIPAMAVEAIIRKALDGDAPRAGARAAIDDLELADYEALFAGRTIHTGIREAGADGSLYATILGETFARLPAPIREMHDIRAAATAEGVARVERGASWLARIAAWAMGFPAAGDDVPVRVKFSSASGVETWERDFGGERFSSQQFAGRGRSDRLLCERFGPLTFAMALVVDGERLSLVLRRWSCLGVALPMWLCPRSHSYETVADGKFRFHVEIAHPLAGLIVRYVGMLERVSDRA